MDLSIGQTVGDYEILSVLGAGGMGKVYQVRNRISGRVEAMKILLPDLSAAHELADRFLREIRISGSLDHPNIAALRTAQRIDNQIIMIMEFVEGSTLDALIKQSKIPVAKGMDYINQALTALKYAHSHGVVHRDIKPGNMMLTPSGMLKLMDFGIAKMATDPRLTKIGLLVGSVYYMSPEQIEGKDLDGRSDLYSLGITLYEIVTGKRPFDGDSEYQIMAAHLKENPPPPLDLDPSLPSDLNDIIMLAMAKDPAQRFQTAEAFQNALSAVSAKQPAVPPPMPQALPHIAPSTAGSAYRNARAWYMLAGSAATIAVIVAGVIEIPKYVHAGAASQPVSIPSVPSPAPVPQQNSAPNPATPPPEQAAPAPGAVSAPAAGARPARPAQVSAGPAVPSAKPQTPVSPVTPQQADSQPPQAVTQPEPPPPRPQSAIPTPPANAAELTDLRERANLMSVRVGTIRTAFQNLQHQQAASGLTPRSDMVAADQRLEYQLQQAQASLGQGDSANARKRLDAAERDIEKLESFLGK
jgi:serine/threonine protein kinase